MSEPLVRLNPGGTPAVVDYHVPEPVAYDGTSILELELPSEAFRPPPVRPMTDLERANLTLERVQDAMAAGFDDARLFPDLGVPAGTIVWADVVPGAEGAAVRFQGCYVASFGPAASEASWTTGRVRRLSPEEVLAHLQRGRNLMFFRLPSHRFDLRFEPARPLRQRLGIVEHHRLTSFLGAYGAGRTLHTFTLLPGETAKITVKSYRRSTTTTRATSSILDSLNDESSTDFENQLQEERSDKSTRSRSDAWHIETDLTASYGIASVKLGAAYKGSSASSREQFGRNVKSAMEKHVAKASNRRDVRVEQAGEDSLDTGDELATERVLRNINVGRTLNFVFRQMNQEYLTLLHLVDVRVGYTDGITTRVVPLHQADALFREVLADDRDWAGDALAWILAELEEVVDHAGKAQRFLETVRRTDAEGKPLGSYVRARTDLRAAYQSPTTGQSYEVPGVLLAVTTSVLRTDGVITEALLGQAEALDGFSRGLQAEAVREQRLRNDRLERQVAREKLAQALVKAKDADAVRRLAKVLPAAATEPEGA